MAQYDTTWFEKGLAELEITLNEKQIEQFLTYYELLVEWNTVMNLTAITEYEEVITKHFLDSVASVKECDYSKPMKILDLGTGAGFPGKNRLPGSGDRPSRLSEQARQIPEHRHRNPRSHRNPRHPRKSRRLRPSGRLQRTVRPVRLPRRSQLKHPVRILPALCKSGRSLYPV